MLSWLFLVLWSMSAVTESNSQSYMCPSNEGMYYATSSDCLLYYLCENHVLWTGACYPWQRFDVHTLACRQMDEVDCNPEYAGVWRPAFGEDHENGEEPNNVGGDNEGQQGINDDNPTGETTEENETESPDQETTELATERENVMQDTTTEKGKMAEGINNDIETGKGTFEKRNICDNGRIAAEEDIREDRSEDDHAQEAIMAKQMVFEQEDDVEQEPSEEKEMLRFVVEEFDTENRDTSTEHGEDSETTVSTANPESDTDATGNMPVAGSELDQSDGNVESGTNTDATQNFAMEGENTSTMSTMAETDQSENNVESVRNSKSDPSQSSSTSETNGQDSLTGVWYWCGSGRYVFVQNVEDGKRVCLELQDPEFIDEEGKEQANGDLAGHSFLGSHVNA